MFDRLKLNISPITRKTLEVSGALFSLIAIVISFISWDDVGIENICYRIGVFAGILLFSIIFSIIYVIFIKKNHTIWKRGNGEINVCYSDIIKKGFQKKIKSNCIVVIPVNTCFDTIVDNDLSAVDKPLVSPNTIHGQWINSMIKAGLSQDGINRKIEGYLNQKKITPKHQIDREIKSRGNLLSYERGTVVVIKRSEEVTFFLLALTEFNDNNNAHCTKEDFIICIKQLIEFYNSNGQGFELNLPLMGTNLSRTGMSHTEALNKIKAVFELYNEQIHGIVNIIIFNKDKEKVSIFD